MRLLLVLRHGLYLRNYENVVRDLAAAGHEVVIGFTARVDHLELDDRSLARRLAAELPEVRELDVVHRQDRWWALAWQLRSLSDLLRYDDPRYHRADALRARARRHVARPLQWLARTAGAGTAHGRRRLERWIHACERAIPPAPEIEAQIEAIAPDVIAVSPLVDFGSRTLDYIKVARARGIPSALLVASWDNLTNKGRIHILPDRVVLWNAEQKREAMELHGVPPGRIEVTGAQLFDHWFERSPSSDRTAFCKKVGLDPDLPYLLYLCSSSFIAPDEVRRVREWVTALRSTQHRNLRRVGVLVRPHPAHSAPWRAADLTPYDNVAVWPLRSSHPVDDDTRRDYFDSLYHCAAAVGVNTSGLIEAGIVGRRCYSMLSPEYTGSQEGTLHFHLLTRGGLLITAHDEKEQLDQLARELAGQAGNGEEIRSFVGRFVRPRGLGAPCAPLVSRALVELAASRRTETPPPTTLPIRLLAATLWPVATLASSLHGLWRRRPRPGARRPEAPSPRVPAAADPSRVA